MADEIDDVMERVQGRSTPGTANRPESDREQADDGTLRTPLLYDVALWVLWAGVVLGALAAGATGSSGEAAAGAALAVGAVFCLVSIVVLKLLWRIVVLLHSREG